jgi:hypothetical protein
MRVKIKIKNKLEGKNNSLIEGLNWKQKKIKKGQKNQNIGTKLEKKQNTTNLNWKIKVKTIEISIKRPKKKKLEINRRSPNWKTLYIAN